jgi:hypothetical protein
MRALSRSPFHLPQIKESPPMSDIGAALAPLARRSSPWSVGSMLSREP